MMLLQEKNSTRRKLQLPLLVPRCIKNVATPYFRHDDTAVARDIARTMTFSSLRFILLAVGFTAAAAVRVGYMGYTPFMFRCFYC